MGDEVSRTITLSDFKDLLQVSDSFRKTLVDSFTVTQLPDIIELSLVKLSGSGECSGAYRVTVTVLLEQIKNASTAEPKRKAATMNDEQEKQSQKTLQVDPDPPPKRKRSTVNHGNSIAASANQAIRPGASSGPPTPEFSGTIQPHSRTECWDPLSPIGRVSHIIKARLTRETESSKPKSKFLVADPLNWMLIVPNLDGNGDNIVPFSSLPEATQEALKYNFDQSYADRASDSRREESARLIRIKNRKRREECVSTLWCQGSHMVK
ncbi:hypothetical protein BDV96DRAFT_649885 [Lophiotrema nucula]|uniref:Uncharacterized protein n=1 Tax=Lophiotrema nucula TaxID=690887 RepID=A0A6A5YXM5_9PLEO|nr:hypothetical protein BDV96DRAFT_649885 [Lophiotrema nucula]